FRRVLFRSIEDVPEHRQLPDHARQRIALLKKDVEGWNSRVDRLEPEAVLDAKMDALGELFAVPRTPARQALLDAYREREGQGLEDFANWLAISGHVRGAQYDLL